MKHFLLAITLLFSALVLPSLALAQESPLQTVMDGREAAQSSNLTEAAIRGGGGNAGLAQKAANIVMVICGALAVAFTAVGLMQLYQVTDAGAQGGPHGATKAGALWKLVIAGLLSIPAVIAAIIPFAVL